MTVLEAARALRPTIQAFAVEMEETRRLPDALAEALAKAGLYRMITPRSVGGLELPPREILEAIEAVAEAEASAGWCVMIGATTGLLGAYLEPGVAAEVFADPMTRTGGVFAPMGKAVAENGHYRVTGRWKWTSGGHVCGWLGGGCMIEEGGALRTFANGAPDHRMMLFPRSDVELIDTWRTAGLKGTGSGDMAVRDVIVPKNRSVSLIADRPTAEGPLYAFPAFGLLAIGIAAVASGAARAAMEEFKALALEKKPTGGKRTLADRGAVQAILGEQHARLAAARAYLLETVDSAWETAKAEGALTPDRRALVRLAATHMTRTGADVARVMADQAGGPAVFLDHPLQRRVRDLQTATAHLMIGPATYELAGRTLFGLPAGDPTF